MLRTSYIWLCIKSECYIRLRWTTDIYILTIRKWNLKKVSCRRNDEKLWYTSAHDCSSNSIVNQEIPYKNVRTTFKHHTAVVYYYLIIQHLTRIECLCERIEAASDEYIFSELKKNEFSFSSFIGITGKEIFCMKGRYI